MIDDCDPGTRNVTKHDRVGDGGTRIGVENADDTVEGDGGGVRHVK